jgi:hypothetical protein
MTQALVLAGLRCDIPFWHHGQWQIRIVRRHSGGIPTSIVYWIEPLFLTRSITPKSDLGDETFLLVNHWTNVSTSVLVCCSLAIPRICWQTLLDDNVCPQLYLITFLWLSKKWKIFEAILFVPKDTYSLDRPAEVISHSVRDVWVDIEDALHEVWNGQLRGIRKRWPLVTVGPHWN